MNERCKLWKHKYKLLHEADWNRRLKIDSVATGNTMSINDIKELNGRIDHESPCDYRLAVSSRTREIVSRLAPHELH